ncbi:MAG: CopG family antitoxin [Chloroflexota bacterium]
MQKSKKIINFIPKDFKTLGEASDFWDVHDISDYWDKTKEAKFKVSLKKEPKYVALEDEIARKVFKIAKKKHISLETLVNVWLKERVSHAG